MLVSDSLTVGRRGRVMMRSVGGRGGGKEGRGEGRKRVRNVKCVRKEEREREGWTNTTYSIEILHCLTLFLH